MKASTYTTEEAIRALARIAKRWPRNNLGLFSNSGTLMVVRLTDGGFPSPGVTNAMRDATLAIIDIPNDGGDAD